jgi:hypothetical protein
MVSFQILSNSSCTSHPINQRHIVSILKEPLNNLDVRILQSGQSFCLQIQRSRVRFLAPPDFLRSDGSGTGSTQHREDN